MYGTKLSNKALAFFVCVCFLGVGVARTSGETDEIPFLESLGVEAGEATPVNITFFCLELVGFASSSRLAFGTYPPSTLPFCSLFFCNSGFTKSI